MTLCGLSCVVTSIPFAAASEVIFHGLLPDGTSISREITTLRDQKFQHIVRQETDYSCGAAALATILKHAYGMGIDEPTVMAGLLSVSNRTEVLQRGFSLLDIKSYVESLGFRARGYRVDIEKLAEIKVPTIALLELDGFRHFVVLRTVIGNEVFIADPALGNRKLTLDEFERAWINQAVFAVIGPGLDRDTPLRQAPAEFDSGRWLAHHSPITNTDLLEFGFKSTELF
ncbi:MAG: C39 family peptidase [Thiotrichales bacterium]